MESICDEALLVKSSVWPCTLWAFCGYAILQTPTSSQNMKLLLGRVLKHKQNLVRKE